MGKARHMDEHAIVTTVRDEFPDIEAIYLFGSFADDSQDANSDVDLALLFPATDYGLVSDNLFMHPLHAHLMDQTGRDVDLVNLRQMPTVLQHEVVMRGRRIYCADETAADQFDIGVMSRYQKLNEERAEILREFELTGRAYKV